MFILYFDGACLPKNPGGVASYGWVLEGGGWKEKGCGIETESGTNNVAEYAGLIHGLEKAVEKEVKELEIRGDSQVVIYQLKGRYSVNSGKLLPYYRRALELLGKFRKVKLVWIPREENGEADKLSTRAYIYHEFLKEYKKKDTIKGCRKTGRDTYLVNGYEVKFSSGPLFYSCTCPHFEKKNSAGLLKRTGIAVPCKHIAFVYYEICRKVRNRE